MQPRRVWMTGVVAALSGLAVVAAAPWQWALAQDQNRQRGDAGPKPGVVQDAITDAQTPRDVQATRPEQQKTAHDRSDVFNPAKAPRSSTALESQPQKGEVQGFDFSRDPLDAKRPMQPADEIVKKDIADKPAVMAAHRKLLESRYDLSPKLDPQAKMSRGKPLPVGPTARLKDGTTFDQLAQMKPEEIKQAGSFPYPPLPHPKHATGGQVFPEVQLAQFPRLRRFDVDFDLPDAFIPEFPPAIFIQNRPELGDVSRGEVVSINNFHHLFKEILTPVQLDGLRMLLTPLPQEEFNATDDRKVAQPSLGVTCLD